MGWTSHPPGWGCGVDPPPTTTRRALGFPYNPDPPLNGNVVLLQLDVIERAVARNEGEFTPVSVSARRRSISASSAAYST